MRAILIVLMLACIAPPALAQNDLQAEEDELKVSEFRLKIMRGVREIDYLLETARDNARPSDLLQKYVIQEDNTGYFLRRAHKIAVELARSVDQNPQWLKRYERRVKVAGAVRRIAAVLHGVETMIRATMDADSSSGAEKIEALADIITDTDVAVNPENPLVSLYVGTMAKAVKNMAQSAKVIEARHDKTIKAIEEDYAMMVYGTDYAEPEVQSHPLDDAIDEAEERLRELRRAASDRAYQDVEDAEEHCYEEYDTDQRKISQTRQGLSRDRDAMRRLAYEHKMIPIRISAVRFQISEARKAILVLEAGSDIKTVLEARAKLLHTQNEITTLERELERLKEAERRNVKPLLDRFYEIRDRYKENARFVKRFNRCVAKQLESAEHADRDYVDWHFPDYQRRPKGTLAVKDPKTLRANAQTAQGLWDGDDWGDTIIYARPRDGIIATYTEDNGRIYGTLQGRQLTGIWVEDAAATKCDKPSPTPNPRMYWGNVILHFNEDFTEFLGEWGYCDDTRDRTWVGKRP